MTKKNEAAVVAGSACEIRVAQELGLPVEGVRNAELMSGITACDVQAAIDAKNIDLSNWRKHYYSDDSLRDAIARTKAGETNKAAEVEAPGREAMKEMEQLAALIFGDENDLKMADEA